MLIGVTRWLMNELSWRWFMLVMLVNVDRGNHQLHSSGMRCIFHGVLDPAGSLGFLGTPVVWVLHKVPWTSIDCQLFASRESQRRPKMGQESSSFCGKMLYLRHDICQMEVANVDPQTCWLPADRDQFCVPYPATEP